eukprot:SAG31_NODE_1664_length_7585_cov_10.994523_6_plen_165_part_00
MGFEVCRSLRGSAGSERRGTCPSTGTRPAVAATPFRASTAMQLLGTPTTRSTRVQRTPLREPSQQQGRGSDSSSTGSLSAARMPISDDALHLSSRQGHKHKKAAVTRNGESRVGTHRHYTCVHARRVELQVCASVAVPAQNAGAYRVQRHTLEKLFRDRLAHRR